MWQIVFDAGTTSCARGVCKGGGTCFHPQLADVHVYRVRKHLTGNEHMYTRDQAVRCAHTNRNPPHPRRSCLLHMWGEVRWNWEEKESSNEREDREKDSKNKARKGKSVQWQTDVRCETKSAATWWCQRLDSTSTQPSLERSWSKEGKRSLSIKL